MRVCGANVMESSMAQSNFKEPPRKIEKKKKKKTTKERKERALETGLEETFPASDAVAATEPAGRNSDETAK